MKPAETPASKSAPAGASSADGHGKRLIFVMGVQRSGTNALRRSLSLSPGVTGFNESAESEYFEDWYLRPEPEIRKHLLKVPAAVLLKPISETQRRTLADVFEEFAAYDLSIVWIYRDPVNVYHSTVTRWRHRWDVDRFIEEWESQNLSALDAVKKYGDRVTVLRYRDLVKDYLVFRSLCKHLQISLAENLFQRESRGGYDNLPKETRDKIVHATSLVWQRLEDARRFRARRRTLKADGKKPPVDKLRVELEALETRLEGSEKAVGVLRREQTELRRRVDKIESTWIWRLGVVASKRLRRASRFIKGEPSRLAARSGDRKVALRLPNGGSVVIRAPSHLHIPRMLEEKGFRGLDTDALAAALALISTRDGLFVDVGANIGVFSILVAAVLKRPCRSFEPLPDAAEVLSRTAAAYELPIDVSRIALSDSEGTAEFFVSAKSDVSSSLNPRFRPVKESFPVTLAKLDQVIQDQKVAVLKIDTETTEPAVLAGATVIIERQRPCVIVEVLQNRTERKIEEFFAGRDYCWYHVTAADTWPAVAAIEGDVTDRNWLFSPEPLAEAFWREMNRWRDRLREC